MGAPIFLSRQEERILRALLRVETPLTGRAVARTTGLSQATAQRALTRLRESGLVVADQAPPSLLYRANAEHLAIPALLALLRLDEQLRARLGEHVAGWQVRPVSVVVYGSVPRRQATVTSDLDVLVVRPDAIAPDAETWQQQLSDLADRVRVWTGRRASIIEMSVDEAAEGMTDREPFLVEAARDGWLIAGQTLSELAAQRR